MLGWTFHVFLGRLCAHPNLSSFLSVKFTLFTPCFRPDPYLSHQVLILVNLDSLSSHDLMIWIDGSVLFVLAKEALESLTTAHWALLRLPFPFGQAQCVQVFLLKRALFFCKFSAISSTNKYATFFPSSLRFSPCSCYIFSLPFFFLPHSFLPVQSFLSTFFFISQQ